MGHAQRGHQERDALLVDQLAQHPALDRPGHADHHHHDDGEHDGENEIVIEPLEGGEQGRTDAAAADLEAATLAADAAEKTWTADQTPALWTKLSNAKGARDQAEVRARSLRAAADGAEVDHANALARVASTKADLVAVEARHQRAADVLEGFRANRAAANEEAARVEGERRRAIAAFGKARESFGADFARVVSPLLARFVRGVRECSDVLQELDEILPGWKRRGEELADQGRALGVLSPSAAHEFSLTSFAWQMCAVTVNLRGGAIHSFLRGRGLAIEHLYQSLPITERRAIDATPITEPMKIAPEPAAVRAAA